MYKSRFAVQLYMNESVHFPFSLPLLLSHKDLLPSPCHIRTCYTFEARKHVQIYDHCTTISEL